MIKRILLLLLIPFVVFGDFPFRQYTETFDVSQLDSRWRTFNWEFNDYTDALITVQFNAVGFDEVVFRMADRMGGTAYLTVEGGIVVQDQGVTTFQFNIPHTNMPPNNTYFAEFLGANAEGEGEDRVLTPVRVLARGRVESVWSVFSSEKAAAFEPVVLLPYAGASIGFVEEAPTDGNQYVRQNESWEEVGEAGVVTDATLDGDGTAEDVLGVAQTIVDGASAGATALQDLSGKTTDNLGEGTNNLYHTEDRVQAIKVDAASDADTVGGLTVQTAVPADALFTDTVYDDFDTDFASKSVGDLSDVTVDSPDARHALIYDVTGYVSRLITEADVSDLGEYLTEEVDPRLPAHGTAGNLLQSDGTAWTSWAPDYITDYTVTESDVTQHQEALEITESQISDLTHYTDAQADARVQAAIQDDATTETNLWSASKIDSELEGKADAYVAYYAPEDGITADMITPEEYFQVNEQGLITNYTGTATNLVIPYKVGGIVVVGTDDFGATASPFYNNTNITSIVAPVTFTTSGNYAFRGCSSLTSVSFQGATSIGDGAFFNCSSLVSASFPNAESIGNSAFANCSSLVSVSIPNATTIGESAFSGCSSLVSVSIPNAESVADFAFYNCSSLTSVFLGSTKPADGSLVFDNTPNVTIYGVGSAWDGISTWNSKPVVQLDKFPSLVVHGDAFVVDTLTATTLQQGGVALGTAAFTDSTAYTPAMTDATHAVFVTAIGDDANSGLTIDQPKATIGGGITASEALITGGASGVRVWVMDGATYTENVTVPADIYVDAKAATLVGTVSVTAGAEIFLDRHFAAANDQNMASMDAAGDGFALYSAGLSDGRGVDGTLTGVNNVRNIGGGGKIFFTRTGIMYVSASGIGIGDTSGGFGHIHFDSPDIYLAGNNAVGVVGTALGGPNTANIVGKTDHILPIAGATGTKAILLDNADAVVSIIASEIRGGHAYEITAGTLHLVAPRIEGTRVGTPASLFSDVLTLTDELDAVTVKQGGVAIGTAAFEDVGALEGDVPQLIVGGVLADDRISVGSVTQHVGSIDHNALLNYEAGEHRTIDDEGTGLTDLWSGSKIDTELGGKSDVASITTITLDANKSWTPAASGDLLRVAVAGNHELEISDPANTNLPIRVSTMLIQDGTNGYQAVLSGNLRTSGGVSLAGIQSTSSNAVDVLRWEWTQADWELVGGTFDVEAP